ncbi:MAG: hypothetical protein AB7J35_16365 [Dehalococcoidia bacterium]
MDTTTFIIVGVAIVVVAIAVVVGLMLWTRKRDDERLHETFGTEYDETYAAAVDRKAARQDLKARQERVESYDLRPLSAEQRRRFAADWQSMQATFVDDPVMAVSRADGLLSQVMRARGYETDIHDDDARIEDVSVGHGDEARAFREATRVAALNRDGRATTEDLRRAIKDYGVVFDALLTERQPA